MENSLPIKSFNFNVVNSPLESLIPTDAFSKIFVRAFQLFPIIQQVANPMIFLRRESGGQLQINPLGIFLKDIETADFSKDVEILIQMVNQYHSECNISEIKELNLRFVSHFQAKFVNGKRMLFVHQVVIPAELSQLIPDTKFHMGFRLVFTDSNTRYDLKIEPRFSNLEENYVDLNIIKPGPIKPSEIMDIVIQQRNFFSTEVLKLIQR